MVEGQDTPETKIITLRMNYFRQVLPLNEQVQTSSIFCLFELILYVTVNSNGHVGTEPPFNGTFTQH